MSQLQRSIVIAAPVPIVWDAVTDLPGTFTGVATVRGIRPVGPRSFSVTAAFGSVTETWLLEIVEQQFPHRLRWQSMQGRPHTGEIVLAPDESDPARTHVDLRVTTEGATTESAFPREGARDFAQEALEALRHRAEERAGRDAPGAAGDAEGAARRATGEAERGSRAGGESPRSESGAFRSGSDAFRSRWRERFESRRGFQGARPDFSWFDMPFSAIRAAAREVDRVAESVIASSGVAQMFAARGWTAWSPRVDCGVRGGAFVVLVDLPGVSREDVRVEVRRGVLSIAGERRAEHVEQGNGHRRHERFAGRFERRIDLPAGADVEHMQARLADGVLEVRVPLAGGDGAHRVEVAAGH